MQVTPLEHLAKMLRFDSLPKVLFVFFLAEGNLLRAISNFF